ncbi:MAG: hypothetical protein NTY12_02800 [Candidatus Falkowbacteria bacterium]|nr:hypothetical protein [Candidatus Falkowbacteria bacterium]
MKNKNFIFAYIVILLLIAAVVIYRDQLLKDFPIKNRPIEKLPNSFNECIATGLPVQETYPRICVLPNGQSFSEDIGNELEKIDLIRVDSPRPNSNIKNPIVITGKARGLWFFEASFPVSLVDENNLEVTSSTAQAQGNWMTEEFVDFTANLIIPNSFSGKATLILKKDNPSGDSSKDDELIIPVNIFN